VSFPFVLVRKRLGELRDDGEVHALVLDAPIPKSEKAREERRRGNEGEEGFVKDDVRGGEEREWAERR
jgi:hypothetical protein